MVERLIFHLGDRKAGSTALQKTLAEGLWRAGPGAPRLAYMARDHNGPLARSLSTLEDAERQEKRFQTLARRLSRVEAEVAVVSSEDFEDVSPAALKAAIDRWLPGWAGRLELVAYVRPHGERFLSGYAEQVRRGQTTAALEAFLAEGVLLERFTMAPRLARWREVFGPAYRVRPAIAARLAGGSVVTDFLALALGQEARLTWAGRANPSPSAAELAALRLVHDAREAAGWPPRRREAAGIALAEAFARMAADGTPGPRAGLTAELVAALREICAEDAAAIDAMFFEDRPFSEALAALAPGGACPDPEAHFSAETRRILAALAVAGDAGPP